MTSAQNARSLATANKKMDLSRQTEHEIAAPLSPDGPHHAPGRRRADPTTVRIEASVGVQTSRFFEDGQSRHVGLDNFGLLIEASCGLASLATSWCALYDPPLRCCQRTARLHFSQITARSARSPSGALGWPRSCSRGRGVRSPDLGQLPQRLQSVQGLAQQRRVVAVGRCHDDPEGDAVCSERDGTRRASIAPVSIHSSRLRRKVVVEHPSSAILQ